MRAGILLALGNHSPRHPDHSTLIFARSPRPPRNTLPIHKSMLSSPEVSQAQHCAYDRPPGRPSSISCHPFVPPLRTVSAPTWPGCSPWFCTSGSNLPTSNSQTFDIQRFNSDWKSDATERVPPVISATGIDRRYRRILAPFEFLNDSANCLGYAVAAIRTLLLFFGAKIDRGFRKAGQFLIGAAFFLQRSVQ